MPEIYSYHECHFVFFLANNILMGSDHHHLKISFFFRLTELDMPIHLCGFFSVLDITISVNFSIQHVHLFTC
jgi:hypothetical protein